MAVKSTFDGQPRDLKLGETHAEEIIHTNSNVE